MTREMEQAMDAVECNFCCDIVPEFASTQLRHCRANDDLTVGKSDHVCGAPDIEKATVDAGHVTVADKCAFDLIEPGQGTTERLGGIQAQRKRGRHDQIEILVIVTDRSLARNNEDPRLGCSRRFPGRRKPVRLHLRVFSGGCMATCRSQLLRPPCRSHSL